MSAGVLLLANKFPLVPSEGGKEFPLDLSGKKNVPLACIGPPAPQLLFPKIAPEVAVWCYV